MAGSIVGPSTASAAAVPIASIAANVTSYALLLAAAHVMTEANYGTLSSLLGLLLIASVPMLALQTVAARRTAADEGVAGVVRGTVVLAAWTTAIFAAASPLVALFLHLHSPVAVLVVAATVPLTAVLGAAMGVAQGRRNFRRLAWLILMTTGGRSLGGIAGLAVRHSPVATLVGILTGTAAAAAVAVASGRHATRLRRDAFQRASAGVVLEAVHAGHAHSAFLLLTSLDVLLARHVLSPTAAGVYGVGSVISRAALWLPQSLVTLMFASLAERGAQRSTARRATLAVAGVGLLVVAGTAALGPLVVTVVGGSKYAQLNATAWLFALLGALLALMQLSVLAGLAQRRVRRTVLLWCTAAADIVVVLSAGHATPTRVVVTLVSVAAVAACLAVVITLRQQAEPAPTDTLSPL
ncbi:MAG TPA: hypothetical protein VGN35_00720 [Jatrophihabitantaceae bacterium]|nr:hypothetical protein [Jatrophihabitantaceae bacterium]